MPADWLGAKMDILVVASLGSGPCPFSVSEVRLLVVSSSTSKPAAELLSDPKHVVDAAGDESSLLLEASQEGGRSLSSSMHFSMSLGANESGGA